MSSAVADRPVFTLLLVAVIATAAAALVTVSWEFSRDRITANERAKLLANLSSVLDPSLLQRDLDPVRITVSDSDLSGSDQATEVFIPMDGLTPLAVVFATTAPNGYNAPISLLVGISYTDGRVTGVRVIDHKETPGLGDLIELRKSDWILQFDGTGVDEPAASGWAVRKDDGVFDAITGATVTPRAVIEAVYDTLLYFDGNRESLTQQAREAVAARARQDNP